jgi:outer membrane protein assembly factor BamB
MHVRRFFASLALNVSLVGASLVYIGLNADAAAAGDWTRFRGPNGTGVVDDPSIPAVPTAADVLWKAELPGIGHSSPVIWGDKVFVTAAGEEPPQRIVVCLNVADGKPLWTRRFDYSVHKKHTLNSFASPTPAVDKDHVYVSWSTPDSLTLMALTHDGRDAWTRDLGPFISQHSAGNSPIVVDDMVILVNEQDDAATAKGEGGGNGGESYLHAVRAKDGSTVWQIPRRSAVVTYSTPMVRELPDGKRELLVNSQAHGLGGIDVATGKTNWEKNDVLKKRSVSSPVYAAGLVFGTCGSGGGGEYIVAVKPGPQPELVYEIKEGAPYVPSLVAKGNLVFAMNSKGIATCFDAATGNVHWRERIGGNFYGSPIILNDRVYVIDTAGKVVIYAANAKFENLGAFELGEGTHSTPAVADGRLFFRTESHLTCIGKK